MAKHYCGTVNNPTYSDEEFREKLDALITTGVLDYYVFQRERSTTGTPHFQVYVIFNKKSTIVKFKRLICERAHVEVCRGTPQDNYEYCTKVESRISGPYMSGELPVSAGRGSRSDLDAAIQTLNSTRSLREVATKHATTFVRCHRGLSAYLQVTCARRTWLTEFFVLYGEPGTGKTTHALSKHPDLFCLPPVQERGTVWWDGYDGQDTVLIDDFRSFCIPYNLLFNYIDRTPLLVPVKGGMVPFLAKRVIATTNEHPRDWYSGLDASTHFQRSALDRRITAIMHFKFDVDGVTPSPNNPVLPDLAPA